MTSTLPGELVPGSFVPGGGEIWKFWKIFSSKIEIFKNFDYLPEVFSSKKKTLEGSH